MLLIFPYWPASVARYSVFRSTGFVLSIASSCDSVSARRIDYGLQGFGWRLATATIRFFPFYFANFTNLMKAKNKNKYRLTSYDKKLSGGVLCLALLLIAVWVLVVAFVSRCH